MRERSSSFLLLWCDRDAHLNGADFTSANLCDAKMVGCVLVSCNLSKAQVTVNTDMTDAVFTPMAAPVRKKSSTQSAMPAAASAVCSTLPGVAHRCLKSLASGHDQDSDGDSDSDASDQEELEQDESDLAQDLGPVIDQIACVAAVVDAAMQDIVFVIRTLVLTPCRLLRSCEGLWKPSSVSCPRLRRVLRGAAGC